MGDKRIESLRQKYPDHPLLVKMVRQQAAYGHLEGLRPGPVASGSNPERLQSLRQKYPGHPLLSSEAAGEEGGSCQA